MPKGFFFLATAGGATGEEPPSEIATLAVWRRGGGSCLPSGIRELQRWLLFAGTPAVDRERGRADEESERPRVERGRADEEWERR
ncbi:hypothetical protein DM860_017119 [Cuscuta australis]|uniref:Uncharacterized protein n=1 Tax=Cuscuta australis TaxID=267555 RepID=A0A328DQX7_9ASTE|nr:hypothetical protein DM860_017119 [Cuscuta australis]